MLKKLLFCLIITAGIVRVHATVNDKMYIDEDDFIVKGDAFHIHIGNNVWLVTDTVHRDTTGLFSYECNINRLSGALKIEYEKKWKCPYCYYYWPVGKPCSNSECPSRYKQ